MSTDPTFSTLWAVNGPLDLEELRAQLDGFVEAGLDGVVFHPRFYPDEPPYLDDEYLALVSALIRDAHARGLAFWIYDENGWPSGTVGGRMLDRHPELRQRWLDLQRDEGQPALRRFERNGEHWALVERFGDGVDYLAPALAERFIELCYTRYADGLEADAFALVAGFFSDEPEFGLGHAQHDLSALGAIPWTPDLPAAYAAAHGRALLDELPAIFFTDPESADARTRFWELVTDLFSERYLARLDAWCRERGVRFTAHMKGEEHPLFQLPTVGSLGMVCRAIGLPGVDALGRHPSNDFYPRQASSVARQFGEGRAMAEAFGGAGWGARPLDLERYLRWLGGHGITEFVLHLSQYRLDSAAIEDWPPSQPLHLSWRAAYREVIRAVRDELAAAPRPPADTLVVVPQRGLARVYEPWEFVATNVHDARDFPLTAAGLVNRSFMQLVAELSAAGVRYEFADERTLEQDGRMVDGCLALGRSRYARVVVADGAVLDAAALELVRPLRHDRPTAGARAEPRRAPEPSRADRAPVALDWTLERHPLNELVLEPAWSEDDGRWVATVASDDFEGPAELLLADEPAELEWHGSRLPWQRRSGGPGAVAEVTVAAGAGSRLAFRTAAELGPGVVPRVWVRGAFRVRGRLRSRGAAASAFDGPFTLTRPADRVERELVDDGFPFLFDPIDVVAELVLPPGVTAVTLTGGMADAACIRLGDGPPAWRWSDGDWTVPIPAGHAGSAGVRLRLRLVPSSFNRYGPHHHYAADPTVVSPAQMHGERNYADVDGAPERTSVEHWWIRRLVLPDAAVVHVADGTATAPERELVREIPLPRIDKLELPS